MKFEALGEYVLVLPSEKVEVETPGGILLPQGSELEQCKIGKVYSVGEKVGTVKVGDTIAYVRPYDMASINLDGKDFFLIRGDDVYGVVAP